MVEVWENKWTESKWLVKKISLPAYNEIKLNVVEINLKNSWKGMTECVCKGFCFLSSLL